MYETQQDAIQDHSGNFFGLTGLVKEVIELNENGTRLAITRLHDLSKGPGDSGNAMPDYLTNSVDFWNDRSDNAKQFKDLVSDVEQGDLVTVAGYRAKSSSGDGRDKRWYLNDIGIFVEVIDTETDTNEDTETEVEIEEETTNEIDELEEEENL